LNEKPRIIQSFISEKYETKEFRQKGIKPFRYFSKKQFKEYIKRNEYAVFGDVKINQKNFKNIAAADNPDKLINKKNRKRIIGTAKMLRTSGVINKSGMYIEAYKSFDIFEKNECRHCIGYAYIGNNRFVRLVKPNLLLFLLFLIFIGSIAGLLSSCPKTPEDAIKWAEEQTIEESTAAIRKQPPNCDFLLFTETTIIDAEHQTIKLVNLPSNEGLYDIDYSVYINENPLLDQNGNAYSTGRITPGNMVMINLYEVLDKGEYLLECRAAEYYQNDGEELPGKYNLSTIVTVNK